MAFGGLSEPDKALVALERAIQLNPDNAENHFGLGYIAQLTGHSARAVKALQKAIDLSADHLDARNLLATLREHWVEVMASEEVRSQAERLLLRHSLKAADALQLGAALAWARGRPSEHRLVTFDARLQRAARGEGFAVIDPDSHLVPTG